MAARISYNAGGGEGGRGKKEKTQQRQNDTPAHKDANVTIALSELCHECSDFSAHFTFNYLAVEMPNLCRQILVKNILTAT